MKVLTQTGLTELITKIKAWGNAVFLKRAEVEQATTIDIDTVPTTDSSNLITSGGVKTALDGKGTYTKPDSGIPKTDLASDVQTSLGKADTALQTHQSLAAYRTASAQDVIDNTKETTANKTAILSSESTDTQYPTAKVVYDNVSAKSTVSASTTGTTATEAKFITIDGVEWKLADSGSATDTNAVHYLAETKTEEQKGIARTNIGAGTYDKPADGIPSTDMTSAVQASLGKADTSIQQHDEYVQDITVGTTGGTARDTALNIGTNADDAYIGFGTKSTSRGKLGVSKNNEPLFYNYYTGQRKIIATTDQLTDKEDTSNKTTVISAESTDTQYPTAKATYDGLSEKYTKPDGGIPSTDLAEAYLPLTAGSTKKLTGTLWSGLVGTSDPTPAFQWNVGTGSYAYNFQLAATSSDASHVSYSARINTGGIAVTDRVIWNAVLYENSTSNSLYLGDTGYFADVYLRSATNLTLEAKSSFASSRSYIKLEGTNVAVGNSSRNNIMYPRNGTSNTAYLGCSSSVDSSVGNKYWTRTFTDNITMTLGGSRQDLATYLGTKEDTSNKVTAITSSSTDTQYPSAKLVYDATQTLQTEINNLKSIGRFLAILDASNGTVSSQPSGSVGDSYSYKVGDYYRVGTAGTYAPKSTATYIIDETSGSSNFEQGSVSYGIGDLIYCSNLTETTSTWVKQQSSGGGAVQDVQVNGTSILSGGVANITSGNLPSHTHTLANITDVSATATELNYLSGTTSNVQTQLDAKGTYSKPDGGIPSTDMTSAVQTSLELADTAVQPAALNSYLPLTAGSTKALTNTLYVNTTNTKSDHTLLALGDRGSEYAGENADWFKVSGYNIGDKHVFNLISYNKIALGYDTSINILNLGTDAYYARLWNKYTVFANSNAFLAPTTDGYGSLGGNLPDGSWSGLKTWGSAYVDTIYTTIAGTRNQNLTTHLAAVDTSIQAKEDTSNKVTSISAASTDTQYPSAKLLYDQLATKQSTLTVNPATTSASLTSIGINGTNYALAGGTQVIWRTY